MYITDNERLQQLRDLVDGKRPALTFPAIEGLQLVLSQLEQRDKTISDLRVKKNRLDNLTEGLAAEREQLITHKYDLLSVVEQMSGCIDAFIKDCKKHNMKIPHDVFFGSYTNLQSACAQALDAMKEAKSV